VILDNNEEINLSDLRNFKYITNQELSSNIVNKDEIPSTYIYPEIINVGDKILYKKSNDEYGEGIIIGRTSGYSKGNKSELKYIFIYNDKDKGLQINTITKPSRILDKSSNIIITQSEINSALETIKILEKSISEKREHFKGLKYSIIDGNEYLPLSTGDILVNKLSTNLIYKVAGSTSDKIKLLNYSSEGTSLVRFFDRSILNNYYILTNKRFNETFAKDNI